MIEAFVESLDVNSIHVQAPTDVVFLCGGELSDLSVTEPKSLRDAFLKIADNPALRGRHLLLAEDANIFYMSKGEYRDFLEFETHLAQITELILLFCESEGSFAELGAFSMVDEIARRMLIVLRDKHYYKNDSFIMLGPVLFLQNKYGDAISYVIDDADVGIADNDNYSTVKVAVLRDRLAPVIEKRLKRIREPTTFDKESPGHVIKAIVGLIQEFGALTLDEIEGALVGIEVLKSPDEIRAYLFCAEAVSWVKKAKKGAKTLYFATTDRDAAIFRMKPGTRLRDKTRRRADIRQYWMETDPDRYRGIVGILTGGR